MLLIIIRREFLSNLLTFRFLIGFILCFGLVTGSAYVLTQDYSQRLQNYTLAVQEHTNDVREVKLYSYLKPQVDRKPEALSIFNAGVDKSLGNTVQIGIAQVPAEAEGGYNALAHHQKGDFRPYKQSTVCLDTGACTYVVHRERAGVHQQLQMEVERLFKGS